MKHSLMIIAGVLAMLVILMVAGSLITQATTPTGLSYARESAEIERLQRQTAQADALAPLDLALAATWRIVPLVALMGAMLYLGALGVAQLTRFRRERLPNSAGLLPVLAADQDTARAALAGFHQARMAEAQRQPVPAHLTYSPHLDYRLDGGRAPELPDLQPAALLPAAVPGFGDLLSRGRIGRGQPLLLGIDAESGSEIPGAWLDLYATATAGLPGSGKTTSQRFFACQTALHGARFVVCDPHASAGDDSLAGTLAPLRSAFLCAPAEDPQAILSAVQLVAGIGEARKSGKDTSTTPIILWVDELTGLLGRSDVGDELAGLLELIAQEYRKKWVYLSASGQIWTASRTTSELRDSLASVLCHRMRRNQARLLLPTEDAAHVERLATGEAILWRTSGVTTRVRIPNTTAADVVRVAEMLTAAPTAAPTAPPEQRPMGFRPTRKGEAYGEAYGEALAEPHRPHQDGINLTPEEARIVAAFLSGKSLSEIAAELNGGRKNGQGFNQAARRVSEILRRVLGAPVEEVKK